MNKQLNNISKQLSYILRHQPKSIGLSLNEQGWANVQELITKLQQQGTGIDLATLEIIVATNDKKRFAFNEDKTMIRASQGHSLEIELSYAPIQPPELLFHGTTYEAWQLIRTKGIMKMNRHHVHLTDNQSTAVQVGHRHGKPVVLTIKALLMYQHQFIFYQSENGVWLTDTVPPEYIENA